jgi:hypothetical protein
VPEYVKDGVAILQYADDTILCIEDKKEQATNLKFLLYLYVFTSWLKINFSKSEAIMVSQDVAKSIEYVNMLKPSDALLGNGQWPMKYLGSLFLDPKFILLTGCL